jgi:hypothetical protein
MATAQKPSQMSVEIVADKFNAYLSQLAAKLPAHEFADIIKGEAIAVLQGAMRRTSVASSKTITASVEAAPWRTMDGKKYKMDHRYPDPVWRKLTAAKRASVRRRMKARGLARQAWVQIADSMGRKIDAPAYVLGAIPASGIRPRNGRSIEEGTGARYTITLFNESPLARYTGAEFALKLAMLGRVRAFENALRKKLFDDARFVARQYKGIEVSGI